MMWNDFSPGSSLATLSLCCCCVFCCSLLFSSFLPSLYRVPGIWRAVCPTRFDFFLGFEFWLLTLFPLLTRFWLFFVFGLYFFLVLIFVSASTFDHCWLDVSVGPTFDFLFKFRRFDNDIAGSWPHFTDPLPLLISMLPFLCFLFVLLVCSLQY